MASNTEGSTQTLKAQEARPRISYVIVILNQSVVYLHAPVPQRQSSLPSSSEKIRSASSSEFFHAALTGGFKEAMDKTVTLADADPKVFEFFVHWLYFQRFPDKKKDDNQELLALWTVKDLDDRLVDLYIFADKYRVEQFQEQALDALFYEIRDSTYLFCAATVNLAFKSLSEDSPLCRLMVDVFCCYESGDMSDVDFDGFDDVFARQMWRRYAERVHKGNKCGCGGLSLVLCNYHNHKDNNERETCERASGREV